jgi:hypothetical protein
MLPATPTSALRTRTQPEVIILSTLGTAVKPQPETMPQPMAVAIRIAPKPLQDAAKPSFKSMTTK